jgi:hypothetical protein
MLFSIDNAASLLHKKIESKLQMAALGRGRKYEEMEAQPRANAEGD